MARQRPREPRATCRGHARGHCDASDCGVDPSASTSVAFGTGLSANLCPSQLALLDSWSGNQRRRLILVSAVAELFFPLLFVALSQSLLGQHGPPQAWPRGCQKIIETDDSQLISVCEHSTADFALGGRMSMTPRARTTSLVTSPSSSHLVSTLTWQRTLLSITSRSTLSRERQPHLRTSSQFFVVDSLAQLSVCNIFACYILCTRAGTSEVTVAAANGEAFVVPTTWWSSLCGETKSWVVLGG